MRACPDHDKKFLLYTHASERTISGIPMRRNDGETRSSVKDRCDKGSYATSGGGGDHCSQVCRTLFYSSELLVRPSPSRIYARPWTKLWE
ncbi:hypothetical protein SUGI_1226280 [Cryptomeria japonica]|uniref:Uncharacterized protein n=1 Tax=Cryptomeria japonica TaxID=3369 RepID=A0AAD3RPF2_CRYJA|nr:hypothetical protein SUGI_1226280 [Cryptomeria japonica]